MQALPSATLPSHRPTVTHQRPRSVPHKRPFIMAVLITSLFHLVLVGAGAALFAFIVNPTRNAALVLIAFGVGSALMWLVSFLKRRTCHCPLCKGTPLVDSSARRHERAVRFFPLNYGTSNVIRALVRQDFRCHYCGTPFDLLKPNVRRQLERAAPPAGLTQETAANHLPLSRPAPLSRPMA